MCRRGSAPAARSRAAHPAVTPFGFDAARRVVEQVSPGPVGDAVVLSVDPSDVYQRGHLPGARWIGRGRLELLIGGAAPDTRAAVLVTCADGVQSTLAAATLRRMGYAAARVLDGGLAAWKAAGLPVETGPAACSTRRTTSCRSPTSAGAPRWRPTSAGKKRSTSAG